MKSQDYWLGELLSLMGADISEFANKPESQKQIKEFKEYVGRIQRDAYENPPESYLKLFKINKK